MQTLRNWKAQRSGAFIRVSGFDTKSQQEVKITAALIEPRRGGQVIATDKDGVEHELIV